MSRETTDSTSSPHFCNRRSRRVVDVSKTHLISLPSSRSYIYSASNFYLLEFDSTLAKMNSRKSSIGPNNPTSWMDNQQTVSQPLNGQKSLKRGEQQSTTLRNMATSASRTQKASPSNFTSGSLRVPNLGGPTSNLRNLAGHLLISGSSTSMRGISLNDALFKKNSDLQASVQEQLMVHQEL